MSGFAVIPDGASVPAAVFEELEDAIDWGVNRFGSDAFTIKQWARPVPEAAGGLMAAASN